MGLKALKNLDEIKNIEKEKKVFLLGMSKTGTTSIEQLLIECGYRVCRGHWNNNVTNYLLSCYVHNDLEEILRLTTYYDAFTDAPWGGGYLHENITRLYPDGLFILSYRDVNDWYTSLENMFLQYDKNYMTTMETMKSFGGYGIVEFFKKIFDISNLYDNMDKIKHYYMNYNEEVRKYFKVNNYKFLEIDITEKNFDSRVITEFINCKRTNRSMPHLNKAK